MRTFANGKSQVYGFHSDLYNKFEKMGLIELTNKVVGKNGCYGAMTRVGNVIDPKTYFNSQWSRRDVVTKVIEAVSNGFDEIVEAARNTPLESYSNDGTPIRVIYKMAGKVLRITTAFPGLEDWKK